MGTIFIGLLGRAKPLLTGKHRRTRRGIRTHDTSFKRPKTVSALGRRVIIKLMSLTSVCSLMTFEKLLKLDIKSWKVSVRIAN